MTAREKEVKTTNLERAPERRDELRPERKHDPYQPHGKYSEGTTCPDCGVHFRQGRWSWEGEPGPHQTLCPACHRMREHLPAGYVSLAGPFVAGHRDELMRLVRHHEQREKSEHPLERIIAAFDNDDGILITTTGIHLARTLGTAVHAAYSGRLDFRYSDAENLVRVFWTR